MQLPAGDASLLDERSTEASQTICSVLETATGSYRSSRMLNWTPFSKEAPRNPVSTVTGMTFLGAAIFTLPSKGTGFSQPKWAADGPITTRINAKTITRTTAIVKLDS